VRQIGKAAVWRPATMPEAVVFDMDGLLLDTERLYTRAIFATCEDLGYKMTTELNLRLIGGPWEANLAELLEVFGDAFPADRYRAQCEAHYLSQCTDGIPLRPSALELVTFLEERAIPMAAATSTLHLTATHHLEEAGLLSKLQGVIARDLVTHGKPHPESYLKAAELLRTHPVACLALEDSHTGARAAIAAGMTTVLVPDMLPASLEIAEQCAHVAFDLHEVHAALAAHAS
jgi:beta-phosphoglucomutase-like phosphatase (HAD superfamily)